MKVLIVEDEVNVAHAIRKGLEERDFEVLLAYDGATALQICIQEKPDLVVLDVIIPGLNGWEVLETLRSKHKFNRPVLMLSALNQTDHVVKGLNSGADDYLSKPFKMDELEARLLALHRRYSGQGIAKRQLKLADLSIDLDTLECERNGKKIKLTAKEFKLLEYFMSNPTRVLSRLQIMEQVWGVDFDLGTNVVDVYVNYLRNKIDKSFSPKLIHTVVGIGYVMKDDES